MWRPVSSSWSRNKNMAHARSLIATTGRLGVQLATSEAAIATGSSVSAQGGRRTPRAPG